MRKVIIILLIVSVLALPVAATEFTAPQAPDSGEMYMPESIDSFGEGLWYVVRSALAAIEPEIVQAAGLCVCVIGITLLTSMLQNASLRTKKIAELASAVGIGILLLQPSGTLIQLGTSTVTEISEYGKLLIPVLTAAVAAQGGVTTSTALYTGTTLFCAILSNLICRLIVPLLYVFLCLCIANSAIGEDLLGKLRDLIKWLMTWLLKIVLYVFTGYISITGVVGGSADASVVKATKLAISGSVPVVGSILSDASEAILVSAGMMKSAAGIYGILAIAATWIGPFLKIGAQYLLLKLTSAACGVFGSKATANLIRDFSVGMGFVLAAISTISILLLIGVVCFMKAVT